LNWSDHIPHSRPALVAAEAVRITQPESHQEFIAATFHAYFALGEDIEDRAVIAECAEDASVDPSAVTAETTSALAEDELRYAERRAHEHHVTGTPSWLVNDELLIVGLRSRGFFTALGHTLSNASDVADQVTTGRPDR
jgi:predicted DsbA family dithiol-disulfide isomerase